jgi:hypothetical protein
MKQKEQIATVARLRSFHAQDQEERLGGALGRWIEDPVRPKMDKGNLRINPILVLTAMAVLAGGTFLFFSLVQL